MWHAIWGSTRAQTQYLLPGSTPGCVEDTPAEPCSSSVRKNTWGSLPGHWVSGPQQRVCPQGAHLAKSSPTEAFLRWCIESIQEDHSWSTFPSQLRHLCQHEATSLPKIIPLPTCSWLLPGFSASDTSQTQVRSALSWPAHRSSLCTRPESPLRRLGMEGLRVGWEKPRPIRDRVRERAQVQHGKQAQAGTSLPTKLTTLGLGIQFWPPQMHLPW